MRILLVGPFPPYRGGISMFNHSLSQELQKDHEVHRISFSLQYPKLLFPGKTQYSNFNGEPASESINSVNPLSWRKTANDINKIYPDLIIFQYWMPFFAPAFTSIAKRLKKSCDAKIIVNCHNITAHEPKPWDNQMTKSFFSYCDGFMVMSNTVEADLKAIKSNPKYKRSPHPIYDVFGDSVDKDKARNSLGLGQENIILYFGLIRDYKGLDILLDSAKLLKNRMKKFKILVAGECYGNENKYIQLAQENNVMDIIDFRFDFVPNEKVSQYFCASDLVVLPYKSATQSGVVPIAYHFDKPVVVSNVGGLHEIVEEGKSGYVCDPTPESISEMIIKFFNEDAVQFTEFISKYKQNFSWSNYINVLMELADL